MEEDAPDIVRHRFPRGFLLCFLKHGRGLERVATEPNPALLNLWFGEPCSPSITPPVLFGIAAPRPIQHPDGGPKRGIRGVINPLQGVVSEHAPDTLRYGLSRDLLFAFLKHVAPEPSPALFDFLWGQPGFLSFAPPVAFDRVGAGAFRRCLPELLQFLGGFCRHLSELLQVLR